jgi:GNAT superfamily N-acetyltransferase
MTLTIKTVTPDSVDDLGRLFATEQVAETCWCMWFIIPVREFHAAGREGNRASFSDLAARSKEPMGLLAYRDGEPVGWCAAGPAARYVRAMKTPTYSAGKASPEAGTWFVPCFFIHRDARGTGVGRALLEAAVQLAQENGATTIEGFPFAGAKKRSSGDIQVGTESLFSACGFEVIRTPSTSRVVMRRTLKG